MHKTVDTRPLFLLGRKRAPHAYKGLSKRLVCYTDVARQTLSRSGKGRQCETMREVGCRITTICKCKGFTQAEKIDVNVSLGSLAEGAVAFQRLAWHESRIYSPKKLHRERRKAKDSSELIK